MTVAARLAAPWAGLAAGPAAWALDTQINYALVEWACGAGGWALSLIAAVLVLVSLGGALSSAVAWKAGDLPHLPIPEQDGHPHRLLAGVGVAFGVLFAIAIALQGLATLVLEPCLR